MLCTRVAAHEASQHQRLYDIAADTMTPMEKYDAENAKLDVVDFMPLMRILLADVWDPSTGEMLVWSC